MSTLLGLNYSDDEEEEQQQQQQRKQEPALPTVESSVQGAGAERSLPDTAAANESASGLVAYAPESDEEHEQTSKQQTDADMQDISVSAPDLEPTHAAAAAPSSSPTPSASPSSAISSVSANHVTPSTSPSSLESTSAIGTNAEPTVSVSATHVPRRTSAATDTYSAYTSYLLSLLPPPPLTPLAPSMALRHQRNESRAFAAARAGRSSLVSGLVSMKSFHNPSILSRLSAQFNIDEGGSNLDQRFWAEQNLKDDDDVMGFKQEDDWETIKKQAEEAHARHLATRTSIDFVPASTTTQPPQSSTISLTAPGAQQKPSVALSRVLEEVKQTASSATNLAASTATSTASRPRKSKWGSKASTSTSTTAPTANPPSHQLSSIAMLNNNIAAPNTTAHMSDAAKRRVMAQAVADEMRKKQRR